MGFSKEFQAPEEDARHRLAVKTEKEKILQSTGLGVVAVL